MAMEKKNQMELEKKSHVSVSNAVLQTATFLPGGRTESTLNISKIPGIEMLWVRNEGLLVKIKGDEALIPDTNVKIVMFSK